MLCPLSQDEQLDIDTGQIHGVLLMSHNCEVRAALLQHKPCQNFFLGGESWGLILFYNLNSNFPFQLYLFSYFLITSVQKYFVLGIANKPVSVISRY